MTVPRGPKSGAWINCVVLLTSEEHKINQCSNHRSDITGPRTSKTSRIPSHSTVPRMSVLVTFSCHINRYARVAAFVVILPKKFRRLLIPTLEEIKQCVHGTVACVSIF
jgi:hypothetical protein